jgi:hypothetical protein
LLPYDTLSEVERNELLRLVEEEWEEKNKKKLERSKNEGKGSGDSDDDDEDDEEEEEVGHIYISFLKFFVTLFSSKPHKTSKVRLS